MLSKVIPLMQRVRGKNDGNTLKMRWNYAFALYANPGATLANLHEAVIMLEAIEPPVRRVFGGTHPLTEDIERSLRLARAAKEASSLGEGMAAMTPRDAQDDPPS